MRGIGLPVPDVPGPALPSHAKEWNHITGGDFCVASAITPVSIEKLKKIEITSVSKDPKGSGQPRPSIQVTMGDNTCSTSTLNKTTPINSKWILCHIYKTPFGVRGSIGFRNERRRISLARTMSIMEHTGFDVRSRVLRLPEVIDPS